MKRIAAQKSELRNFGLVLGTLLIGFFAVLPRLLHGRRILWPWIAGAILWILALAFPILLRPVHTGWLKFGQTLGWINSRIILVLTYFLVIIPTAMVLRLLGRDRMERQFDRSRESYRTSASEQPGKRMEQPF